MRSETKGVEMLHSTGKMGLKTYLVESKCCDAKQELVARILNSELNEYCELVAEISVKGMTRLIFSQVGMPPRLYEQQVQCFAHGLKRHVLLPSLIKRVKKKGAKFEADAHLAHAANFNAAARVVLQYLQPSLHLLRYGVRQRGLKCCIQQKWV